MPDSNFLLLMMTIDSLFSAIHYFKAYLDSDLTYSQIIVESSAQYDYGLLDRYIYYILQYIFYILTCNTFWLKACKPLYYGTLISIIPPFLNIILKTGFFERIRKKKEEMVKVVASKQMASLVELSSKTYLHKEIKVHYEEILPLMNNYHATIGYFQDGLKNALLIMLLTYMKKYSSNIYYKTTKYIYKYKTGNMLQSFNTESAKKMLADIIDNKKWGQLVQPNVYRAIFQLYQINDDNDMFKVLLVSFNHKTAKMFAIWTLSSFFKRFLVAPVISIFFHLYKQGIRFDFDNLMHFMFITSSFIIGEALNSYFMLSFLSQFAFACLYNNIAFTVYGYLVKEVYKVFCLLNETNKDYIVPTLSTGAFVMTYGYFINSQMLIVPLLHLIYILGLNNDFKKSFLYLGLLITGLISSFNPLHLSHNMIMFYVILAFMRPDIFSKLWLTVKDKIYKPKNKIQYLDIDEYPSLSSESLKETQSLCLPRENEHLNNQTVVRQCKSVFNPDSEDELSRSFLISHVGKVDLIEDYL